MPRILIAECKQEVSTFNPHLSGYDDFGIRRGEELLDYHRTVRNEVGGALSVFDAAAGCGTRARLQRVLHHLGRHAREGGLAAHRGRSSSTPSARRRRWMACISACTARWPARTNSIPKAICSPRRARFLGEDIPIVVSLDLHGILTDRMLEHSDAIVAYHTYPHVDFFETGQRAARLLLRIIAGEVRPVTAKVAIPALVRGDELITATGFFGQSIRIAQEVENGPGGLSAGMFIGNPFTDVPALADLQLCRDRQRSRAAPSARRSASPKASGRITRRCGCRW